jgi:hypothetical protein
VEGNLWKTHLPQVQAGKWYFRQLFANDNRMTRARTPNADAPEPYFITTGPLSAYAPVIKTWDFVNRTKLFYNQVEAFCGFGFREGDISYIEDYKNAEVLTHHSWESSWQTIRRIDTVKNEIYFNTPSWCPPGLFGDESLHIRYVVENVRAALDQPGEWYLDKASGELFYIALSGEDVEKMNFIAPAIEELLVISGTADAPVQHVNFSGLSFQHNNYPMGVYINTIHEEGFNEPKFLPVLDWPAFVKKQYPDWPTDFSPGYMEPQAAVYAGQAILLKNATNVAFENCSIAHTGNYGIYIAERTNNIAVKQCHLYDLGAGGVKIGIPVINVATSNIPATDVSYGNIIADNFIHDIGKTQPGGVGIWLAQTRDNQIIHNELYNFPYTGISIGWTWNPINTFTANNLIANNHIHHVMHTLTDGGGIYTLGKLNKSILRENFIHDIIRHFNAAGGDSQGIFFDESSQDASIERNVIWNMKKPIGFNATKKENMRWDENFLDSGNLGDAARAIAEKAGPRKNAVKK